jgi:uncharacterized protein YdiU (UPF0061 family)
LVEALLPLLGSDEKSAVGEAEAALAAFGPTFEAAYAAGLRRKLGILRSDDEGAADDLALVRDLLMLMADGEADFTLTFRHLNAAVEKGDGSGDAAVAALFGKGVDPRPWLAQWRARLVEDGAPSDERQSVMRRANPAIIPRNHRVEQAIAAAVNNDDFALFHSMVEGLSKPFDDDPDYADLATPPQPGEEVRETFCGT